MFRKSYYFLIFLVLMYGLIPLKISEILGSSFLIGDFVDNDLTFDLSLLTIGTFFFLSPMLNKTIILPSLNLYGRFAEKVGYNIYMIYLVFLIFLGSTLRLIGTERSALLEILSITFVQGMGFILILFYLKFIKTDKKILIIVSILFCVIDILFMGKQYFISLVTILIFLADYHSFKFSFFHIFSIFIGSVLFIFIINSSRGDFTEIDLFSTLMEFRGVASSIQFSSHDISIFELSAFRSNVEKECFDIYGYNLAFHPLMYFRSITAYTSLNILTYSFIVYCLFKLMIKTIGVYAILILALNFIHFLRHGIDLFLIKIFFQFLIVFLFRIKLHQSRSHV